MVRPALLAFDPSPYFSIPNLSARSIVSLCRALMGEAPGRRPEAASVALGRLWDETQELEAALTQRNRSDAAALMLAEQELDGAADGAWRGVRDGLLALTHFGRPGFVTLAAAPGLSVDYAARLDRARRAQAMHDRLFTRGGLAFLRSRMSEQSASMASLLRMIDEDGLAAEIDELCGAGSIALLRDIQRHYEDVVQSRAARRSTSAYDLKVGITRVRQAIAGYTLALMGMINPDKPETSETVAAALQPILHFRNLASSARASAGQGGSEAPDGAELEDEAPQDAAVAE